MFERLILFTIQFFEFALKELDRAYYETYGDKASKDGEMLSYEFTKEIDKRRFINKDLYLKQAAIYVGKKTLEEEGYIMSPLQALAIAEAMFREAEQEGKIDFLNNVINEE